MPYRLLYMALLAGLVSSCAFTEHRIGYYPFEEKEPQENCDVKIATLAVVDAIEMVEIGTYQLGETPFLTLPASCTKAEALEAIRAEACKADADFANIVFENYPTFMQECYHCSVVLYRVPKAMEDKLDVAIAASQKSEPKADSNYVLVYLGKFTKLVAIFGAAIGILQILSLTRPK